nr:MAG TPA: hypothetical protein [Bacteriophage sp.]
MKYKMNFHNPIQVFEFEAKSHQELLDNFLALNKGFHFGEIKRYGNVTKCDVFDCFDNFVDVIKITSSK